MFHVFLLLIAINSLRVESLDLTDADEIDQFVEDLYKTLKDAKNEEDVTKALLNAIHSLQVKSLSITDADEINQFVEDLYKTLKDTKNEEDVTKALLDAIDTVDETAANYKDISELGQSPVMEDGEIDAEIKQSSRCRDLVNIRYSKLKKMFTTESDEDRTKIKEEISLEAYVNRDEFMLCMQDVALSFTDILSSGSSLIVKVAIILKEENIDNPEDVLLAVYSAGITTNLKASIVRDYDAFLSSGQKENFRNSLNKIKDHTKSYAKLYAEELTEALKELSNE